MLVAVVPSAMSLSAPPRQRLLEANGGCWEGLFHRLGPDGREIERFPTRLRVSDEDGTIEAAHTYLNTGRTVPMRFSEPPAAMQIKVDPPPAGGSDGAFKTLLTPQTKGAGPERNSGYNNTERQEMDRLIRGHQ